MLRSSWETSDGSRPTGWQDKKKCSNPGKRPPEGAGKLQAVIKRQNESVVSRSIYHGARSCRGAELTPWLWTGGTKEVGARLRWTWEVRCHSGDGYTYDHQIEQDVLLGIRRIHRYTLNAFVRCSFKYILLLLSEPCICPGFVRTPVFHSLQHSL